MTIPDAAATVDTDHLDGGFGGGGAAVLARREPTAVKMITALDRSVCLDRETGCSPRGHGRHLPSSARAHRVFAREG